MHSPVLSQWGFLRKILRRQKSTKSYVVEASGGEEGDETDMAIFRVTPSNVEGRARLKQREVDLDDAIVEDTPSSKIKGMRPQETHDVEGSSKIRTRFGSVAREIKAKKPRLDVEESEQKRTRSGSVVRGIKAKKPRLDAVINS